MKRFGNILLVVESRRDHGVALQRAISLAENNQATLTVCAVVDAVPDERQMAIVAATATELCDVAVAEKRDELEEIVSNFGNDGVLIRTKVLVGKPFIEIIRQVLIDGHDLIIKSAEGYTGLKEMLFGSTDMHLMRKCPCPVWIVKATQEARYHRILAAVDRDPEDERKNALSQQILEMSTSLAIAEVGELHVVHVWRLVGEHVYRSPRTSVSESEVDAMVAEEASERKLWLKSLVNTYGTKADKDMVDYLKPQLHVMKGDAKSIIPMTARKLDVDLIIMGTVARVGVPGFFMGNTAESILNQIDCSVLTIKPPGFVSPVLP